MDDAPRLARARFYQRRSFWKKLAAVVLGLFLLYLLVGFFLLPWIIRGQLESRLEEATGRDVAVEKVRFNPLLLKLSVEAFAIAGGEFPGSAADTGATPPLVAFDRLVVDVSIRSVRHFAPVVQLLRLERPSAHVARLADGELNVADIIEHISRREEPEEPSQGTPRFWIDRLEIVEGAVEVRDASVEPLFSHRTDPINLALADLGSLSDAASEGRMEAQLAEGAKFAWSGNVQLEPLGSTGRIVLEAVRIEPFHPYFENVAAVSLGSSRMSIDLPYTLNPGPGEELLSLAGARVALEAIEVSGRNEGDAPFLQLQSLLLDGIDLRLTARSLSVSDVRLSDGGVRLERAEDGSIALLDLLASPSSAAGDEERQLAASAPTPAAGESEAPWTFSVERVAIERFALDYSDASFGQPFAYAFNVDSLTLEGISDALDRSVPLSLDGTFDGSGGLRVRGQVTPEPMAAELDIVLAELPMSPFAPVAAAFAAVDEVMGTASFEGRIVMQPETGEGLPPTSVTGRAIVTGLGLVGGGEGQRILDVETISVEGLEAQAEPLSLTVSEIGVTRPQVLVVRTEDGGLNWLQLLNAPGDAVEPDLSGEEDGVAEPSETPPEAESAGAENPPVVLEVAIIRLEDGRIHFQDRSVEPVVDESIQDLNVTVNDFALAGDEPVRLQLEALLRDGSQLSGQGQWAAADFAAGAELGLNLRQFRLPPLSPYSAAFIGREIASGALTLEMRYALRDAQLDGDQSITLSQFELGQNVPSEGALDLPIGLAVSLLRDRNGTIQLDVPISGDLEDPQFDLASVIASAFGNIVQRAATAPFRMLGSVFGGGDGAADADLSFVAFAAGSAELDDASRTKLGTLARALTSGRG